MPFRPDAGDTLTIEGVLFRIAEHPAAPGIPYGQEGRAATVYQIVAGEEKRALKVFKARFQLPAMVTLAERIEAYAALPGLRVCKRTVITARRHLEVVRQEPDLVYSVLMPWIEGPTWMEVLLSGSEFTPGSSLWLGRTMVEILAGMEERGLAHCDLSGPNILIPALTARPLTSESNAIELVDVEQLYGPGLDQPEYIPSGSAGYAHRTAPAGLWNTRADRFSGALIVAEMLAWCDERVRREAWGESYFDPAEIQQKSERYSIMLSALTDHWGAGVANLLDQAWQSDVLADCPTFARWLAALPDQVTLQEPAQAQAQAPAAGAEILAPAGQGPEDDLARLFDDGLMAHSQGKWAQAKELLAEVVRRKADYSRDGRQAAVLLADTEQRISGPAMQAAEPQQAPALRVTAQPMPVSPQPQVEAVSQVGAGPSTAQEPLVGQGVAERITAAPKDRSAGTAPAKRRQGRKWFWAVPVALVLLVVAFIAVTSYQGQLATQATATQTSQAAQTQEAATAEVAAAETAQAEAAVKTAEAQVTATEVALEAASAQQAQAGATRQAGEAATVEAQARDTALAIKASLTASPQPAAFSVENRDRVAPLRRLRGQVGGVSKVAFSPDGQLVATTSQDRKIRLWKAADGTLLRTLVGQESNVQSLAFAPGGHLLASSSYDGVRLWEIETGVNVRTLEGHGQRVSSVAFSPDGTLLASPSDDKTARIWRVVDGTTLHVLTGHREELSDVAFSPDGKRVATASMDSTVRVWNVADGSLFRELSGPKGDLLKEGATSPGENGENVQAEGGVLSVAFSPDGTRVAAGAEEPEGGDSTSDIYTIWLWTVEDGAPERVLKGPESPVDSLAFSPDGQVLVTNGSYRGDIGMWRVQDGAILRVLSGHTSGVYHLAFSPDGQHLITGSSDGTAVLWGIPQGNEPPTPAPVQAGIGGTGELDGLKITLNAVRYGREGVTKQDGSAADLGDGSEYLFANVTLENITDAPKPLYLPGEFKVFNTWQNTFSPIDATREARVADSLLEKAGEQLAPHAKVTGEIAFVLDLDDKDLKLEYWPMLSPGEVVFKLDR